MDLIQLIEEMEDLMDGASTVPFSKKVMVDADEVLEILTEMREALPEEIKQAQWVTEEKERITFVACGMATFDVGLGYDLYHTALKEGIGTKLTLWDDPYQK